MQRRLVQLDKDHPGFRDEHYRQRRDFIARIAHEHHTGQPVPQAPYTEDEHGVWRHILNTLAPLHHELVCRELNAVQNTMQLNRSEIPQLAQINRTLEASTGFRMEPVAGLVTAKVFLECLADKVFLSTQYIRHHSRPMYTPEPDVVHELVGHAASLLHPDIVALCVAFGQRAKNADDATLTKLIRVFWYTLEFGALEEDGQIKAYGAGLLSSAGELTRYRTQADLRDWDIERIAHTEFDPTDYQPQIYVAPTFSKMVQDLMFWLKNAVF